ncbi:MarR family transcriptional regulator [Kribbella deserti]|uniref:MarR family transcriptional regulator n=1 Tax=Kribbella deserti TaxID=1926257 RepID=A0ABV6QJS0_9ACTN
MTVEETGLALPAQLVPAPAGIASVQTEHLMGDVSSALRLLDAVERVRGHAHPLILDLQDAVGMKMPAALLLSAVAAGRNTAEAVAQQLGTSAAEAELALSDLAAMGLVRLQPDLTVTVTDAGLARLAQLDGLTVRVLDVVTGILGPEDAATLARLLHTVADGLETAVVTSGTDRQL